LAINHNAYTIYLWTKNNVYIIIGSMKKRFKKLMLKQISQQLNNFAALKELRIPKDGWVRTIRSALGMSMAQLGSRIDLSQPRIHAIEKAEVDGTITMNTLRKVADALNCELVYALLPRKGLEAMREQQAMLVAERLMSRVSHTMALEKQGVAKEQTEFQFRELVNQLLNDSPTKLWELDQHDDQLSGRSDSANLRRSRGVTPTTHYDPRSIK
jgi:predicted DNA-binding mobile mystery protein A